MQNRLLPNGLEVRKEGGLLGPGTLAQDVLRAGRRDSERKKGCCHGNGLPDWWAVLFSALGSALGWEGAVLAQVKGTSVKMRSNHNCRRPAHQATLHLARSTSLHITGLGSSSSDEQLSYLDVAPAEERGPVQAP